MKYFVILILVGFAVVVPANAVYGMWFPQSTDELLEQSETVFVGTVVSVNVLEFERSNTRHIEENGITRIEIKNYTQTLDEYTIDIEEFLKNPQTSNTITMLEATVGGVPGRSVSIGGFELGDRVLFYVPIIDGENQYSPESFKIPKYCDAQTVLEQPRIQLSNEFKMTQNGVELSDNFTANIPIKSVYEKDTRTLEGKSFDIIMKINNIEDGREKILEGNVHIKSELCEWVTHTDMEFTLPSGKYLMFMQIIEDDQSSSWSQKFTVIEENLEPNTKCAPETVLENGICPPNCGPNTFLNEIGVCQIIDGGCEPDINGNTTWCGPTYDHWKIFFSSPTAMLFVFGTLGLIVGIPIIVIYYIKKKRKKHED